MITEFSIITSTGIEFHLNLNIKDIEEKRYPDGTEEEWMKYANSMTKGIRWKNNGKTIEFLEEGINIRGYPFPDLEKVLVSYTKNDNHPFSSPRNAVIYNADGSIYMHLEEPKEFLSNLAKSQRPKPYFDYYDSGSWKKNKLGEWVMSINLVYNYYFYEGRIIDELTGELGEVVDSGRF